MKRIIVCILIAVAATSAFAQEKGRTRFGLDIGYAHSAGASLDMNLLYNIRDNMNVGIRLGDVLKTVESQVKERVFDAGITNYSATGNYYFNLENRSAIFVGGGLGLYKLRVFHHDHQHRVHNYGGKEFGGFLTTGVEIRKFRLALEYNLLPSSSVLIPNRNDDTRVKDTVKNSYFAITVGFYLGGGKWKK